jgi:hypothetical protein
VCGRAVSVACAVPSSNKKREVITIDEIEEVQEVESSVKLHPMGRNSMKQKMEEEKILASVSKRMELKEQHQHHCF